MSGRVLAWPAGGHPYQELVYGELRKRGWEVTDFTRLRLVCLAHDVVHLHWPDLVLIERRPRLRALKAGALLALLALARLRGRAVVWTVHNPSLRAEQATSWGERYLALVARLCSGLIFLSEEHSEAYGVSAQDKPSAVIPIPHFRDLYGRGRESSATRDRLGLAAGAPVAGFFGVVRPYKQLEALVEAFQELDDRDARLLVAGLFDERCRPLARSLRDDPRAVLIDRHTEDREVAEILAAMDVVVLPYRELGNSAVALAALSTGRPVLAPVSAGSMRELQRTVGSNWVRLYEPPLDSGQLSAALRAARPVAQPDLGLYRPERVGDLTDRFLRSLLDREPAPTRS